MEATLLEESLHYKAKNQTIEDFAEVLSNFNIDYWSLPNNDRSLGLHRIFQYPAMMVSEVQMNLIAIIKHHFPNIKSLIDPFSGGGTALTAGLYNGLECYGQDINPLSILVSDVKTKSYFNSTLQQYTDAILKSVKEDHSEEIIITFQNFDKWFNVVIAKELSKLRRAILQIPHSKYRKYFWVALAETVRLCSNDRTSTYKLHARSEEDKKKRVVSAFDVFQSIISTCNTDIKLHNDSLQKFFGEREVEGKIYLEDSSNKIHLTTNGHKYDLLVTSPPYGDNHTTITYGQHSYLPLQWIPEYEIRDGLDLVEYLKTTQEIDRLSLGGSGAKRCESIYQSLLKKCPSLELFRKQLENDPKKRVYKVLNFFVDFEKVLKNVTLVMKIGSFQIWTIGNRKVAGLEVPNDSILNELLEYYNFKKITVLSREIHRKRMPEKNSSVSTMKQEQILITRFYG